MFLWWWIACFWAFMIPYNITSALGYSLHIREKYVKFITWFSRKIGNIGKENIKAYSSKEDPMQQHPVTITTLPLNRSFGTFKRDFQLSDACGFITNGLQVPKNYVSQVLVNKNINMAKQLYYSEIHSKDIESIYRSI